MNSAVRQYFQKIGRKGGKAGKGSPKRKAASRKAAQSRWRRQHPIPKPPEK